MKDFFQPAPAFGPYDAAAPLTRPDTSTPVRLAAVAVENLIRHDALETGVFISSDGKELQRRTGQPNRVSFTHAELADKESSTFTHNHPGNGSFSIDDYDAALFSKVFELRAVSPLFRHVLQLGPQPPARHTLEQLSKQWAPQLCAAVLAANQADRLHPAWFGIELQHAFWSRAARRFGFIYLRERS